MRNLTSGVVSELPCAGVFVAIGHSPNTKLFEGQLDLDQAGYIKTYGGMRTSAQGLLAAGTVRSGSAGRAASAAGDGAMAGLSADRYLKDGEW